MLVEDTTAFVEQLEVRPDDRNDEKLRRRRAEAELAALRADWERRIAADALRQLEQELASVPEAASRRRRRLEHRIRRTRGRVRSLETQTLAARERLRWLDPQVGLRERPPSGAKVFRLHSAQHHLECSERWFRRLATSQSDLPMLVAKKEGRRWWWFLDRFWWDEDGLQPRDVKLIVLEGDLHRKQQAESIARARARVLGEEAGAVASDPPVSPLVRFAVWCRDRGRCVDCGTSKDVVFDGILPRDEAVGRRGFDFELRCEACRDRRLHNQDRTRVGRAQVGATSHLF
jgi:hypothetical protein